MAEVIMFFLLLITCLWWTWVVQEILLSIYIPRVPKNLSDDFFKMNETSREFEIDGIIYKYRCSQHSTTLSYKIKDCDIYVQRHKFSEVEDHWGQVLSIKVNNRRVSRWQRKQLLRPIKHVIKAIREEIKTTKIKKKLNLTSRQREEDVRFKQAIRDASLLDVFEAKTKEDFATLMLSPDTAEREIAIARNKELNKFK